MDSILFNLFLNDIVLFIKTSSLTNYADDNTLIDFAKKAYEVISHWNEEVEVCLDWFSRNGMSANPNKFQLMMKNGRRTRIVVVFVYVLIKTFFFQNVTPQLLALNHLRTRQEVYGINYKTFLELVRHWKILRQTFSLCDIYILLCI